jgi:hypothetical protein
LPAGDASGREGEREKKESRRLFSLRILIRFPFAALRFREEDWNEAFNYTSNLAFVDKCLQDSQGKSMAFDRVRRLPFNPSCQLFGWSINPPLCSGILHSAPLLACFLCSS